MDIPTLVHIQMECIYALAQLLEAEGASHAPIRSEMRSYILRAETAEMHALDFHSHPYRKDRMVYVRWLSEYQLGLSKLLEAVLS